MKFLKNTFAILLFLFATQVFAEPVPGKDYTLLQNPQATNTGNKIEVLSSFSTVAHIVSTCTLN